MSDLISRQDAFRAVLGVTTYDTVDDVEIHCDASVSDSEGWLGGVRDALRAIEDVPSAEPETFEFCSGGDNPCKEYDREKHCCHRWTKVIRQTIVEVKQQYALEHPKIVHCNECFYAESADDKEDGYRCTHAMNRNRSVIWFGGDFCSYGERNDE